MSRSRRGRRRFERERAKRARPERRFSAAARLGLLAGGIVLVVGGVLLLTSGGPQTAARLSRVAGILILLGLVAVGVAAVGRV